MLWHYTTTIHLVVILCANNGCLSAAYENIFTFRCILWSASELWLKACVSKPSSPLHSSSSLWRVSISGLWFSGGRGEEGEQGSGWVCSSGQDGTATVEALWEERAAFRFSANKDRETAGLLCMQLCVLRYTKTGSIVKKYRKKYLLKHVGSINMWVWIYPCACTLPIKRLRLVKYFLSLKVPDAHQGCIHLIKNTVQTNSEILLQFK